jgi:hypothetical protein
MGFQDWRKFGAPPGSPGQVSHHPGVKEHEFIAWLLTMHFLSVLELMVGLGDDLVCPSAEPETPPMDASVPLRRPLAMEATQQNLTKPWNSIFFGERSAHNADQWVMNSVHCRTTFEPTVRGTKGGLSELIVIGSIGENLNVMLPKSNMYYNRGWVLDLSETEKKAKRKLDLFGGLGFIDSKKAYYGLFTSGALRLLLPYTGPQSPKVGDLASTYYKSVVVCEVNEKREFGACNTPEDVSFTVGGVNATSAVVDRTTFMGKKICVYIEVPETARLTTRVVIKEQYAKPSSLLPPDTTEEERERDAAVGLEVQIKVINKHIMSTGKACSVSHVVWEEAATT